MRISLFKKFNYIVLTLTLTTFSVVNAQDVRVIDNKGTIRELFVPSVSERFPNANQTVTEATTFTTINFQSQDFAPDVNDYTNVANGITVLNDGRYRITFRITSEVVNNSRVGGEFRMTKNGIAVNNTSSYTYQRNNLVDKNTVTVVKILDLTANDVIGVEGRVYNSSRNTADSLTILAEGSMLTVEKVN
ncbi:hypothetical protein [uncultured Winogradskyella sp.]|uniref:hypothetical protein n=1 Tax=uncultured Winogradskyella sp. TaxID=395353 RepID=UPI00262F72C6|nr:hypothetical protein [uncultured Winogradskyella sp.]